MNKKEKPVSLEDLSTILAKLREKYENITNNVKKVEEKVDENVAEVGVLVDMGKILID